MSNLGLGTDKKNNKNKQIKQQKIKLKPFGFRASVYSLLFGTLVINVLSLGLPVMTLQVYDRILPNPGSGTLPVLVTGVCLAVFLEALLRLCRAYILGRSGAAYEHRMACEAMGKVLNADLSKIGPYGVGEHLHRMGSIAKLKDFYNGYAMTVYAELLFVPLFFGLIVYLAGVLAAVPALILFGFTGISLWRGYCLRKALKEREIADDKRFNFLIETLEGVHTVKSFALERFFERRYEALEEKSCQENYNVTEETANTFNTGAVFSHLMVAAVISFGAVLVLQGNLTTGGLIATLLLSGRMMQPIQRALALWAKYQDFTLAKEHVQELMATPQKQVFEHLYDKNLAADGSLELKNVSFRYQESDNYQLKHVNLKIKRGETILITGAHGSGKTTLLNLIAGIYPPDEGDILIDHQNVNTYPTDVLPQHVGYIRTTSMVFRGTIRDNITCFGQISEARAQEVAALLNVDKDVARLPGGFDTFLSGNNTDSIPPGLKHRISMVRVLATKPRLIMFDNADRSLDKDGYAMIYSLLARLRNKVSMVLISDDYNIKSLADRSYVLRDGTLFDAEDRYEKSNIKPYRELRL